MTAQRRQLAGQGVPIRKLAPLSAGCRGQGRRTSSITWCHLLLHPRLTKAMKVSRSCRPRRHLPMSLLLQAPVKLQIRRPPGRPSRRRRARVVRASRSFAGSMIHSMLLRAALCEATAKARNRQFEAYGIGPASVMLRKMKKKMMMKRVLLNQRRHRKSAMILDNALHRALRDRHNARTIACEARRSQCASTWHTHIKPSKATTSTLRTANTARRPLLLRVRIQQLMLTTWPCSSINGLHRRR